MSRSAVVPFSHSCVSLWQGGAVGAEPEAVQGSLSLKELAQVLNVTQSFSNRQNRLFNENFVANVGQSLEGSPYCHCQVTFHSFIHSLLSLIFCLDFHRTSWERMRWACLSCTATVCWHKVTLRLLCVRVCWIPVFLHLLRKWRASWKNCFKSEEL